MRHALWKNVSAHGDDFSKWTPPRLTRIDEAYEPLDRIEDLLFKQRHETGELFAFFGGRLVVSEFGQTKVAVGDVLPVLLILE